MPGPAQRRGEVCSSEGRCAGPAALKLGLSGPVKVRDVWAKKDLPNAQTSFSTVVPYHDGIFLVFMPVGSAWPLPFELADWMKIPPPPVPTTTEP